MENGRNSFDIILYPFNVHSICILLVGTTSNEDKSIIRSIYIFNSGIFICQCRYTKDIEQLFAKMYCGDCKKGDQGDIGCD